VSVLWGRTKLRLRGLKWKERRETEIAPETLLRLDVLRAASHSLAMVDTIRGADFNARWLSLALGVGERSRVTVAIATESILQASYDKRSVARAMKLVETVRQLAASSNNPLLSGWVAMCEGSCDYWACRLPTAEQGIREAERVFRDYAGTASELKSARMFLTFILRHRGSWSQLRDLREELVEAAERRGDRYVVTSMNRYCVSVWLAEDDPDTARRIVADAKWMLPNISFHTQHWYELDARAEIAMYANTVERDMPEIATLFDGLDSSVLLRVTTVHAMAFWLRGRLALCLGDRKAAQRAVDGLAKNDNDRARVCGAMIEAGIAGRSRDAAAVTKLREAMKLAEQFDLRLHAAAARYQLGKLLAGSEGADHITAAEKIMVAEGVAIPAQFANWFVPGLEK